MVIKEPKSEKEKAIIDTLVEKGKKDGNPLEPKFPSAQLWFSFSPDAQTYFQEIVIQSCGDWETYEREMKKHWPSEKTTMPIKETIKEQR